MTEAVRFSAVDSPRSRAAIATVVVSLHLLLLLAGWLFLPHAAPLPFDPDKVIDVIDVLPPPPPSPEPTPTPPPSPSPTPEPAQTPPPQASPQSAAPPPTLNEPVATDITSKDLQLQASDQPQGPVGPVDPHATGTGPVGTPAAPAPAEIEYQPQYALSVLPSIPQNEFKRRIVYPALAAKQGIEATVILMIWVDQYGKIKKIQVQKDPGLGFAEAAVAALDGLVISPGEIKGQPVATAFRQVIPFKLK